MKTTETFTQKDTKNLKSDANDQQVVGTIARPTRSLRPMKSMARIKSIKPNRIELVAKKRKVIKGF